MRPSSRREPLLKRVDSAAGLKHTKATITDDARQKNISATIPRREPMRIDRASRYQGCCQGVVAEM